MSVSSVCSDASVSSVCSDASVSSVCSDASVSSVCSDASVTSVCSDASVSSVWSDAIAETPTLAQCFQYFFEYFEGHFRILSNKHRKWDVVKKSISPLFLFYLPGVSGVAYSASILLSSRSSVSTAN